MMQDEEEVGDLEPPTPEERRLFDQFLQHNGYKDRNIELLGAWMENAHQAMAVSYLPDENSFLAEEGPIGGGGHWGHNYNAGVISESTLKRHGKTWLEALEAPGPAHKRIAAKIRQALGAANPRSSSS